MAAGCQADHARYGIHCRTLEAPDPSKGQHMTTKIAARISAARASRTEAGMSTAEYAVGTVSACGFAGILYQILTSNWGQNLLEGILEKVTGLLPF
jgi:Protein of unknown function (DUF4244)